MTKPHHVRCALLIALTIVAALVAGYMVYLTSCAAAEQTAQNNKQGDCVHDFGHNPPFSLQ